ncbi:PIG-L family deacetylase [Methylobacterium sp. WL6]|uniref:PIG-L deacetylase family protein n=1 Tax=Methylobacterium sp. WL6 TaxID=2603901 RepID=UPI0011C90DFF|nr:PIG-L family deacetylase [Methylobacterium sp. WL6]TXN69588.1 PIG-L family deacetylase [Methylobacterium sp. WL6]
MPTALALSPHLDDAAFSCGGTLATLAASGWRVVMATVFTQSVPGPTGFALACQLDKGLDASVDYMRLRRAEDEAAARCLGVEVRHLPFREAPHRGYGSAPDLFAEPHADDGIVEHLVPAFRALLNDIAPDLILAPQAIGGHVDHLQVVAAFRRIGSRQPVLWWRDFPYTVRDTVPKAPLAASFAGLPVRQVDLDRAAQEAKAEACAAYATQLGFQFGGRAALMDCLGAEGGRERVSVAGILPDGCPGFDAAA